MKKLSALCFQRLGSSPPSVENRSAVRIGYGVVLEAPSVGSSSGRWMSYFFILA